MSAPEGPIALTPAPATIGGEDGPLHIVLVEPLIPPNTGNIARLCAGIGAWLHLVEPMAFQLDHRKLKRAGLDYWPNVRLTVHPDYAAFEERLSLPHAYYFSAKATRRYSDIAYPAGAVLVFGKETTGLGDAIRAARQEHLVTIPIGSAIRSLNLSNSVAVAAYEVLRQHDFGAAS